MKTKETYASLDSRLQCVWLQMFKVKFECVLVTSMTFRP